jgi:4-hydroxybenzoate polyprenyltransferase
MLASVSGSSTLLAARALRPRQWRHFLLLPAAPLCVEWRTGAFVYGVGIAALALVYAYGLNSLSDGATDLDARKNPLVSIAVYPPELPLLLFGAGLGALGLSLAAGGTAPWAVGASLSAATLYSIGPRLKALPLIGTLVNAAIFAPLLLVAPDATLSPPVRFLGTAFITLLLQNQLLHERADADEDAAARALTTGRVLGERATRAAVLWIGGLGLALTASSAPSKATGLVAAAALAGVTARALLGPNGAAERRRLHRRCSLCAGAFLFGVLIA